MQTVPVFLNVFNLRQRPYGNSFFIIFSPTVQNKALQVYINEVV